MFSIHSGVSKSIRDIRMHFRSFRKCTFFCFAMLFLFISMISCSSHKIKPDVSAEERMALAIKMFEKKHYLDAKTQFRIITLSNSGSSIADKAQFYLAECHFYLKEYILSASEYERLIKVYPNSEYVDDAKYKLGFSYYNLSPKYSLDQEYTQKAIQEFQEFLEDYHSSPLAAQVSEKLYQTREKLARKVYSAAEQYRKMGFYEAASVYFQKVLENYYDSSFGPKAQYWLGECYKKLQKNSEAMEAFATFLIKYPKHELAAKATERLAGLREASTKNVSGSKEAESANASTKP